MVSYTPGDEYAKVSAGKDGGDPLFLPMEHLQSQSVTRAPVTPQDIRPGCRLFAYGADLCVSGIEDSGEILPYLPLIDTVVLNDQ